MHVECYTGGTCPCEWTLNSAFRSVDVDDGCVCGLVCPAAGGKKKGKGEQVEALTVEAVCESLLLLLAVPQTVALASVDGDVLQVLCCDMQTVFTRVRRPLLLVTCCDDQRGSLMAY